MMESKASTSTKSTKASRKRTKSNTTTQESSKKRRTTRSMQRKMTAQNVEMKENDTYSEVIFQEDMTAVGYTMKLQQQQQQCAKFACKENILEHNDGLGNPIHINTGPLRPKQRYQQLLQQQPPPVQLALPTPVHEHQCGQQHYQYSELRKEYNPEPIDLTPTSSEHHKSLDTTPTTATYPRHFFPSGAPPHVRSRQQQSCKLRISQLISCDSSEPTPTSPLPSLQWVRSADLWRTMRSKDVSKAAPEAELRLHHPGILSSMRVILLDWMMEVCEEYKLHRETYYLAMDMFDRFMDSRAGVKKEQLQLLGVTCLFISSKIEEIYPPKAADFAYVTDGACSVADLLDTELIICKVLNWKLHHNVVTVNTWVNTYMQLGSRHLRPPRVKAKEFEFPAYSCVEFTRVMKLLDLCSLDIASRQFGSSVLAASAVYLQSERSRADLAAITGFEPSDIQMCVNWLHPCAIILNQKPAAAQKTFPGVPPHDTHNIQTHDVSISMLEDCAEVRQSQETTPSQYALLQDCSVLMTPPRSSERRCLAPINTFC